MFNVENRNWNAFVIAGKKVLQEILNLSRFYPFVFYQPPYERERKSKRHRSHNGTKESANEWMNERRVEKNIFTHLHIYFHFSLRNSNDKAKVTSCIAFWDLMGIYTHMQLWITVWKWSVIFRKVGNSITRPIYERFWVCACVCVINTLCWFFFLLVET